jgi:hypothetical protein
MSEDNVDRDPGHDPDPEVLEEQPAATVDVASLQAEVEELRSYKAETEEKRRTGWRRVVVILLIVLGCVIGAAANVAVWLKDTALNTNAWVAAVGPLSRDPAIALAIGDYAVGELFAEVDAQQMVSEALPPEASFLAAPLVGAMQDFASEIAADVINSDAFNAIWTAANRLAHEQAVSLLRDQGGLFYVSGGEVTIDLSDLVGSVQDTLTSTGLELFEDLPLTEDSGKLVIYEGARLARMQQIVTILDRAGLLLPLLSLAAFGIAVWVSLWRRRTLLQIGVGAAITMALSLLVLRLARSQVLDQVANALYRAAAEAVWDIVLRGLVVQTVVVLLVGVIIAVGAFLAGPSPRAVAVRGAAQDFLGNKG